MMEKSSNQTLPCKHEAIHFEVGGLYVVCSDCNDHWRSVIGPNWIVVNPIARTQGLNKQDVRKKP